MAAWVTWPCLPCTDLLKVAWGSIHTYIYVCRTFGVYLRKALVAIVNTMPSGAGPGLADLKFRKFKSFRNFRNFQYFKISEISKI